MQVRVEFFNYKRIRSSRVHSCSIEYSLFQQTFEEILNQWRERIDPQLQDQPEVRVNWSIPTIHGLKQINWLRPGLSLEIDEISGQTDFQVGGQYTEADVRWQLVFLTSGYLNVALQQCNQITMIQPKLQCNYLVFAGVGTFGVWHGLAEQVVQAVEIAIAPWLMNQFIQEYEIRFPSEFQPFIDGSFEQPYYQSAPNTPEIEMALHQLLHCPYQGRLRQLYLESKVIELIVLKLAQIQTTSESSTSVLRGQDRERIHAARTILLSNMEHPPSLLALARQVGLNDYKLKQGFREVFGTTVFGYLRLQRMERARQLLTQGTLSVSEVSRMVGYSSPTQFSLAFKRQFGILPSACTQKRSV